MAIQRVHGIVPGKESAIHHEPHIEGSRVTVRYVQRCVEEHGLCPETIANRHELDRADVYAALTYYYNNPEEMHAVEKRHEEAVEEAKRRSSLSPPGS